MKTNINIFDVIFNINSEKFGETETEFFSKVGTRTLTIDKGNFAMYAITDEGCRSIRLIGQTTRSRQLQTAIQEKDEALVKRITTSILDQQMEEISIMVFRLQDKMAHFVKEVKTYRRESFMQKGRDQLVYILAEKQDINDVLTSVEYLEDITIEDRDEFFRPSSIKDTDEWYSILKHVSIKVREEVGFDCKFLGGSPDNGLFLLSSAKEPASVGAAQKLAKIMMAGGVNCNEMDIEFTLVEFPKEVDGVFAILDRKRSRKFNAINALNGKVYQTRMFKDGVFAIKGTMCRPLTGVLKNIIGRNTAVLDVNEYNKTFGLDKKVGDKVTISEIRVMSTDADCGERPVRVSNQLMSRVPINYLDKLTGIVEKTTAKMAEDAMCNPKSFLPKYGMASLMRDITPIEFSNTDYQLLADRELKHQIRTIVRKGVTVPGAYLYHIPSLAIGFDECLISYKWAISNGIKIGDRVSFNIYPALLPDDDEQSNFLFSKKVAGFLGANAVSLSTEAAKAALRDFDGDKLVVTIAYILGDQSKTDYTETLSGVRSPLLAKKYNELAAIEAFMKLGSSIGIIDWWVEIATKMYPNIDRKFLNNCMQADIYSKKHTIKSGYDMNTLKIYLQENCPNMWTFLDSLDDNKKSNYKKQVRRARINAHPDVTARKLAKNINFDIESVDTENMSIAMSITVDALKGIELAEIETQSQRQFRSKAYDILVPFQNKLAEMSNMKNAIVAYSKTLNALDSIDAKKAAFRNLGRELKSKLGAESYTMMSMYLMISSSEFSSLFFPIMFSDRTTLKMIDAGKTVMFAGEVKTTQVSSTIEVWRPRFILEDGTFDKVTPSITLSEFNVGDKIVVKGGKIQMDRPANTVNCIDGEYIVESRMPSYSKDGKVKLNTRIILGIK